MYEEQTACAKVEKAAPRAEVFEKDLATVKKQADELRIILINTRNSISGSEPTIEQPKEGDDIASHFWARAEDIKSDIASTIEECIGIARSIRNQFQA